MNKEELKTFFKEVKESIMIKKSHINKLDDDIMEGTPNHEFVYRLEIINSNLNELIDLLWEEE